MLAHVTTARDGAFAFLNVPAGAEHVLLDLDAMPVDFDAPAATDVVVELQRGDTRRVAFGLIPLGSVHGHVFEDVNKNGEIDPEDHPVDGAVLTLDGGARSELARNGAYRFEAVRSGDHRVELLKESLPEGTTILGGSERPADINREQPQVDVTYLTTVEKRPEVRKVFPPKVGRAGPLAEPAAVPSKGLAVTGPERSRPPAAGIYTIQIAALNNSARAQTIVAERKGDGFAAYLVEPPAGDSPYRVRVGRFATRASAQQTAVRLQSRSRGRLWVTTTR